MSRVIAYVDGFNLYYGTKEAYKNRFLWLNLLGFCEEYCREGQSLLGVKYFTARIGGGRKDHPAWLKSKLDAKRVRQNQYLEALESVCGEKLIIHYGKYRTEVVSCRNCQVEYDEHEEKMTDVNIATHMLLDAIEDEFDTAFLISGDSDLVPPVEAILDKYPEKKIVCIFPPRRNCVELKNIATLDLKVYESKLKKNQLADIVLKADGTEIPRPAKWR